MSKFPGRLVELGLASEATRGAGATPVLWLPHVSLSIADRVVDARVGSKLGRLADSEQRHVLTKFADGEVGGEIRSQTIGYFLYSLLGSLSTGSVVDSSYTHSFSISNTANSGKSLALVIKDPNQTQMYRLAVVRSLEIETPLDNVAQFTADIVSRVAADSDEESSYSTEYKFPKNDTKLKFAANIAGIAAASAVSPKMVRLRMAKEVINDDVLGTAEPEDFLTANFSVEGELELNYEDQTYRNYFKDGTYRALELVIQNTGATIGAGSTVPSLMIQLPRVDFFMWEPDYPLNAPSTQRVSFKGNYDVANSQEIVHLCDLVNGVSSY